MVSLKLGCLSIQRSQFAVPGIEIGNEPDHCTGGKTVYDMILIDL